MKIAVCESAKEKSRMNTFCLDFLSPVAHCRLYKFMKQWFKIQSLQARAVDGGGLRCDCKSGWRQEQ